MTPTEQDKELREKIEKQFDDFIKQLRVNTPDGWEIKKYIDLDEVLSFITADRKRVELEARLDERGEDELLQRLVVYMSFYVEARDAKSVEGMGKWIHKILSMITGAYSDGFQKASKGAFKSQQAAKREAVEAVLDRLEKQVKSLIRNPDGSSIGAEYIPLSAIEAERNKLNNSDGDVK